MSRYLISYKVNSAIQPADPKVLLKQTEENMAKADELLKAGIFLEHGVFNPGEGYIIAEFHSKEEAYELGERFWPGITMNIREVISWEKAKEITLTILKERAE